MADTLVKVRIEGIAAGGAGFARIEGKSIFIEGSAPDETILCRITGEHRTWSQGELLEIVEPSQDRIQPVCSLYGICGGCNMQHLSYTAQLAAKSGILQDTFVRIGGFEPPQPLVFPSEPWEYRNRMQFHAIRGHKTGVLWGLKARKGSKLIPVSDCPIADPGIRGILRDEKQKTTMPLPPEKDRFTVYSRCGVILCEGGTTRGKVRILDRELALDAGVFFQSNGSMLEKLIMDLREISLSADRGLPMADIYCGVGTFAAFLGASFPRIDLIEENKTALALARENLPQIESTALFALRSETWAKTGIHPRSHGLIIVDPPRQGLNMALALKLAADGPPLLAYVSCDPATLARDSKILIEGGYTLTELRCYDFYPQTAHIESLAVFAKQPHRQPHSIE